MKEVLGGDPDAKQIELLEAIGRGERRVAVRSGHGVGKTTTLAWAIVWHTNMRYPQKTVCTAPTSAQLFDALAAETKSWFKKLPPTLYDLFEIKQESIHLKTAPEDSFVSFRTSRPDTPEALAGIHAPHVLLIGDEASGIPEQVFEAAAGSMSGHNATTVLAGNPVRTSGLFFDVFNKTGLAETWCKVHISCENHPRIAKDFVEDSERKWGRDSNAFRVRVLGEFPLSDADTVISYELVEAARTRDITPSKYRPIWGVDCARFGTDRSALAKRTTTELLEPIKAWQGLDTMQLAGRIQDEYKQTTPELRPEEICVDVIGLGAGVVDRLRELGLPVRGINVSESPALGDRFRNLRAELWWEAREWFVGRGCKLADDPELADELVKVKYKFAPNGKLQIESKDEMKKRGLKSPDLADAFVLTFASKATSALHGSSQRLNWKEPIRRVIKGLV